MSKRIIFTFDDRAYEQLQTVMKNGNYSSMADTVRHGLAVLNALQNQKSQGYNRVIVSNRRGHERELAI